MSPFKRNIPLLALSQALMMSGMSMLLTTAALVGAVLAPDVRQATLPLAALFIAMMLTSVPASLLMQRIGRKAGFLIATGFSITGAALSTLALLNKQFWLFVAGFALIGIFNGFGNYFRFAAVEVASAAQKSQAVAYVLAGGVVAAFVGPNLANFTRDLVVNTPFAGSYAALIGLYLLALLVLACLDLPARSAGEDNQGADNTGRPLSVVAAQPGFVAALVCGMFGYGVMTLIMTATPLAMHQHQHVFGDTVFVIQWHVLGMFVPSFFTGHLIGRFGVVPVLLTGVVLGLLCVGINLVGHSVWHYWTALLLLGISWNFLFIGATVLLTEAYRSEERAKAQALNDFAVFSTVALASLTAGVLQNAYGWQTVNLGVIPMLVLIGASVVWVWTAMGGGTVRVAGESPSEEQVP